MNFPDKLQQESHRWVSEGIISREQQQQILSRYPIETVWYRQSGFLLRALALSLLAIALILIISANWQHLPRATRSLVALLPMLVAHGLAYWFYLREKRNFLELSLFFGGIALGANIFLQAQIYHIDSFYPDGFFWWMVGILPPLLWLKSRPLTYLMVILYILHSTMLMKYHHFSPLAVTFLAAAGWVVIKNPSTPLLLLTFVALQLLLVHLQLYEKQETAIFLFLVALAMLARQILFLAARHLNLQRVVGSLGSLVYWGALFLWYLITFADLPGMALEGKISLTLSAVFVASTVLLFWLPEIERMRYYQLFVFLLVTLVIRLLPDRFLPYEKAKSLLSVLLNVLFLGGALWFLRYGLRHKEKGIFFSGVAMLVALAFGRYLDLVGDYLSSALLFAACGVGIWLLNRYWEHRYVGK